MLNIDGTQIRWLYCLACRGAFQLSERSCSCGRSVAGLLEDGRIEVRGPAKALTPVDVVVHVDGGEWAIVPDDPRIHRVTVSAA